MTDNRESKLKIAQEAAAANRADEAVAWDKANAPYHRAKTCFNCRSAYGLLTCDRRKGFHPIRKLALELQGCGEWADGEFEAVKNELPISHFRQRGKPWKEEVAAHRAAARKKYDSGYRVAIPELPPEPPPIIGDPLEWMKPKASAGGEA